MILHVYGFDLIKIFGYRGELLQNTDNSPRNSTRRISVSELLACKLAVKDGSVSPMIADIPKSTRSRR